jgi:hypothetical protein
VAVGRTPVINKIYDGDSVVTLIQVNYV